MFHRVRGARMRGSLLVLLACLATPATAASAYEGRIAGEFHGWDGETVYKLQDGHIIQQASYHYHYHYAYSPEVMIYQSRSGGLKIHVQGDDDEDVTVQVLK